MNSNLVSRSIELEREGFAEVLIVVNQSEADRTRRSYFNPGNLHTVSATARSCQILNLHFCFLLSQLRQICSTGFYATSAPFLAMRKMQNLPESG